MELETPQSLVWSKSKDLTTSTGRAYSVARPVGVEAQSLPVLYLLHGQFDNEEDWWSLNKGQLAQILTDQKALAMVIVMPLCGDEKKPNPKDQPEPDLNAFLVDFDDIRKEILKQNPNPPHEAILGISMGGKQALSIALKNPGIYSALGVLSGKLQSDHLEPPQLIINNPSMRKTGRLPSSSLSARGDVAKVKHGTSVEEH